MLPTQNTFKRNASPGVHRSRIRQRGVFAIMSVPLLLVIFGFCALALDLSQLYNRKVDMSGFAKAVALAAAHELNGTPAGITAATTQARITAERLKYQYFSTGRSFIWNDNALTLSKTPVRSGTWVAASSGSTDVPNLYYAKVDTAELTDGSGVVSTIFAQLITRNLAPIRVSDSAIAGRAAINVMPIAVCAMGDAAAARSATTSTGATVTELVQYGFRRGVSYDLMLLNPNGTTPVNYAINPVSAPGATGAAFNIDAIGPFMCTGTMWVPRITGGPISVSRLATVHPLAPFFMPLNSRFNKYNDSVCNPNGAPPDRNVLPYGYDATGAGRWMSPTSGRAAALTTTIRGRLETVADLAPATPAASAGDYGPLWAYAKAVRIPSPLTAPEPNIGYSVLSSADWPTIYKSGPTAVSYPPSPPYQSLSPASGYYQAPATNLAIATQQRRILNIPLLDCSSGSPSGANVSANVLAIGKFFMTVPATSDALVAEFAGVRPEQALSSQVGLYP